PPEAIPEGDHQSGVINRELSCPLEDLYPDGQAAGQVGQEIYGCGAAFAFATRCHHDVEDAPFRHYCNYFIGASERTGEQALSIQRNDGESCYAEVSLVRLKRKPLPEAPMITSRADKISPHESSDDRMDLRDQASGRYILT